MGFTFKNAEMVEKCYWYSWWENCGLSHLLIWSTTISRLHSFLLFLKCIALTRFPADKRKHIHTQNNCKHINMFAENSFVWIRIVCADFFLLLLYYWCLEPSILVVFKKKEEKSKVEKEATCCSSCVLNWTNAKRTKKTIKITADSGPCETAE